MKNRIFILIFVLTLLFSYNAIAQNANNDLNWLEKMASEGDTLTDFSSWNVGQTTFYLPTNSGVNVAGWDALNSYWNLSTSGTGDTLTVQPQIRLFSYWADLGSSFNLVNGGTTSMLKYVDNDTSATFLQPLIANDVRFKITADDSTNVLQYEILRFKYRDAN
jgi:hypothetical protein